MGLQVADYFYQWVIIQNTKETKRIHYFVLYSCFKMGTRPMQTFLKSHRNSQQACEKVLQTTNNQGEV